jgi:transcriptional regulator with XRE-family HTH domain
MALSDEERFKLLHGPYSPPTAQVGDWLECEIRGRVRVVQWSDGPIPWPRAGRGRTAPYILCGDLMRAVRVESSEAIQHWWGVGRGIVTKWRQALNVKRYNEGTTRLTRIWMPEKIDEETDARARRLAAHPLSRLKVQETYRRNNSLHVNNPFRPEEDALLGTMSDDAVARRIGRLASAVTKRRLKLGIPPYDENVWRVRRHCFYEIDGGKILARRIALGISQREAGRRSGIGPHYFGNLERGLRHPSPLTLQRLARGLECQPEDLLRDPSSTVKTVAWTKEIESLLGTRPDSEIAEQLGWSKKSILQRRQLLKIPSFGDRRRGRTIAVLPNAARMRQLRHHLGLSLQEMEKRTNFFRYHRAEAGVIRIKRSSLARIAQVLGCDVEELIVAEND